MNDTRKTVPTSTHWGNYLVESDGVDLKAVHHYDADKNPTPIGQSLLDAKDKNCRVAEPMVRRSYLKHREKSSGSDRGKEAFVAVSWDVALDLAAGALERTREEHGNEAIYGGSYGWASAGR
ncbi:MAG: biotin/methionine sulfoxide reductase, partial [Gammaproteobacteria bacterium]